MDKETHKFIEDVSTLGYDLGLPKSAARLIGYLLVCEPRAQSANKISMTLKMTPGAVTGALNLLEHIELIRKYSRKGELVYEFEAKSWATSLQYRLSGVSRVVQQAEAGLKLFPDNERLQVMHRIYVAYDKETKRILKKITEAANDK